MRDTLLITVGKYLKDMLAKNRLFTGSLQLNFKDGKLKDFDEHKRTKVKEEGS